MTQRSTSEIAGQVAAPTPTAWKASTGVGAVLSAAHRDRDGNMHGHTWEIVAWWDGTPDAMEKQADLNRYLSFFDHSVLADVVAWGEHLGARIAEDLGCVRVEVNRPLERIYARIDALTERQAA